jgi:hypothetical protein
MSTLKFRARHLQVSVLVFFSFLQPDVTHYVHSTIPFIPVTSLRSRTTNSCLLLHHFHDVTLPPLTVMDIMLSRMTVVLAAILVPYLCSPAEEWLYSCDCPKLELSMMYACHRWHPLMNFVQISSERWLEMVNWPGQPTLQHRAMLHLCQLSPSCHQ